MKVEYIKIIKEEFDIIFEAYIKYMLEKERSKERLSMGQRKKMEIERQRDMRMRKVGCDIYGVKILCEDCMLARNALQCASFCYESQPVILEEVDDE